MPPPWRNQRAPTAGDTPLAAAACSLDSPFAIARQNSRSTSRRTGGRPGERIDGRPVTAVTHPRGRPIVTPSLRALRRPLESAQYTSIRYSNRLLDAGAVASIGTVADSYDTQSMISVVDVGSLA